MYPKKPILYRIILYYYTPLVYWTLLEMSDMQHGQFWGGGDIFPMDHIFKYTLTIDWILFIQSVSISES